MNCKWMVVIVITLLGALISSAGYAAGQTESGPSNMAEYGRLTVVEGEILNVGDRRIDVNVAGAPRRLLVGEGSTVLMNGRPACLQALRPIADHCYFMGRLWLDQAGVVRVVEGDYRGAAVRLLRTTPMETGGARILAECTEEAGEPQCLFETTSDCRGVNEALSAKSIIEAYILFDRHGKVRGIFF